MDEKQISENLKKFRMAKKLTIEELAKLSGLTKGYISKLENSLKAPPFSTLIKLANALDIDITLFLTDDSEFPKDLNICVIRKNERKSIESRGTLYGYNYEALAYKKVGKNMEPYIISPAFGEKAMFSHEGEEFMFVLEGVHEFTYDGEKYLLNEGDSIYFDAKLPHSGRSIGGRRAKVLAVMYSYKR